MDEGLAGQTARIGKRERGLLEAVVEKSQEERTRSKYWLIWDAIIKFDSKESVCEIMDRLEISGESAQCLVLLVRTWFYILKCLVTFRLMNALLYVKKLNVMKI